MKRWGLVWIVAILSCIPIILVRSADPGLLQDSDTAFLLKVIRTQQDPAYWFTHDWPLQNHFYRPVSTLAFELDNWLHGNQAAGYGLMNALIACACVLLLAWLMRELSDSLALALGCTALFGLWHWASLGWLSTLLLYGAWLIGFLGIFRHGFRIGRFLPACGALSYLAIEIIGIESFSYRIVHWLPGRTASVMTLFCLAAMAAYARFERTTALRLEPVPTAMDEPAGTRSSVVDDSKPMAPWIWLVISFLACALALGSYEQAVMLPAAISAIAVSLRLQRYQVRWFWLTVFWGLLGLYILARKQFLPAGVSGYQDQQLLAGTGGLFTFLANYVFPSRATVLTLARSLDVGPSLLLLGQLYSWLWSIFSNIAGYVAAFRHWILGLTGFALSITAYLPMAWLHQFEHYHYWPMALRTLFVLVLAWGAWELCVIAVSPPARKAPPRQTPAPGSLPHL
jgi:hypothetical protein